MKPRSHRVVCPAAYLTLLSLVMIAVVTPSQVTAKAPGISEKLSKPVNKLPIQPTAVPTVTSPRAIVIPRENCGTHWTGWVDDPTANVNPCPTNCERGEQLALNQHKIGDNTQYDAHYQCYLPELVINQPPDALKQLAATAVRENCGTYWTGWIDDPNADVNPCRKGCERGELRSVNRSRPSDKMLYDLNFQCYMPEIPTLSMPVDAPSSGENCGTYWTGWMDTLDTEVNPCPQNCVRGQLPTVKTGLSDLGIKYDVNYQCYTATAATSPESQAKKSIVGVRAKLRPGDLSPAVEPSTDNIEAPAGTEVQPVSSAPQGVSVVGGRTASSASGIEAAPIAARGSSAVANRLVSMDNLEGPGTTITAITDVTITSLTVKWKPVPGASAYVLQATAVGLNNTVTGPEIPQPANLPNEMTAPLAGLATGVDNTVWISVRYPDGRRGMSDEKTVTMLPAENPKEFKAVSIGPGAVRLEWQFSPGAIHYFVEGSNLPHIQTTNTAVAVTNLTPGIHEWTLIAAYPPGVYDDLNPSRLLATVAPDVSGRARYRVTVNGFKVNRETVDDVLQRDGKGDEVFVASYVAEYNMANGQRLRSDVVKTPVFGDKNGFGSDRLLAGNISESGGLRRNDTYPIANPAFRIGTPSYQDMPYIIWEGDLIAGENYIVFVPTIWEWDGDGRSFDWWATSFDKISPQANIREAQEAPYRELQQNLQEAVSGQRFSGWPEAELRSFGYRKFYGTSSPLIPPSMPNEDRPIGVKKLADSDTAEYIERAFALSREFIEGELTRSSQTALPPGVMSIQLVDDRNVSIFGGDYTLYLQVERLP